MDRRQVLKMFGALAAAGMTGAAAACTAEPEDTGMEEPSGRSINIGLITPALGPYAAIGAEISRGFKLYLADHDGLIGRHRVVLKTAEEGDKAASAVAATKELLAQDVVALVGLANPNAVESVSAVVGKAKVPLVCAGGSPVVPGAHYVWGTAHQPGEAGKALAGYALSQGGRAYVLANADATARSEADQFVRELAELGAQPLNAIADASGGDFAAHLQNAKAAGADVIFAAYTGEEALTLLTAFEKSGVRAKLVGPATLTETVDLTKIGDYRGNVYTAGYYAPDIDNDANRRFVSSYHKQHQNPPSTFAMAAYDSGSVLDKALRTLDGEPNAFDLNAGFSNLGQLESPRGIWAFNINRTPLQKWYLRRLRLDGQIPANLLDQDLAVPIL